MAKQFSDVYFAFGVVTSSIPSAAAPGVQLLPVNPERKAFYVFNDSPNVLFVKIGPAGTTNDYSFQIPALGLYESPNFPVPTGSIWGTWGAASGSARLTDIS